LFISAYYAKVSAVIDGSSQTSQWIPEWHPSGLGSVLWSFKSVYRSRTESQWMNVAKNGDVHTVLRTVPDGNCAGSKWHVAKTTDFNTFQLPETDFNTFQLPEEPAAPAWPSRKE